MAESAASRHKLANIIRRREFTERLGGVFLYALGEGRRIPPQPQLMQWLGVQQRLGVATAIGALSGDGVLVPTRRRSKAPTVITGPAFAAARLRYAEPDAADRAEFELWSPGRMLTSLPIHTVVDAVMREAASELEGGGRFWDAATLSERVGVPPRLAREATLRLYEKGWLDVPGDGAARIDEARLMRFRLRALTRAAPGREWLTPLTAEPAVWEHEAPSGTRRLVGIWPRVGVLVGTEDDDDAPEWSVVATARQLVSDDVAAIRLANILAIRKAIGMPKVARHELPQGIVAPPGPRMAVSIHPPDAMHLAVVMPQGRHLHVRIPTFGKPEVLSVGGDAGARRRLTIAVEAHRAALVAARTSGYMARVIKELRKLVAAL